MAALTALLLLLTAAATKADRLNLNGGVIVHMFEWKWEDIAQECEDFLGPMGYKGIQTSPPNENLVIGDRPWWERYQPVSYKLTTRSGTEDQLRDMVRRCNKVGVRVFADVVFNHMTGDCSGDCRGTAGSSCNPGSLSFPSYSRSDFHTPECDISNYNDATNVRVCKLSGLHDLNQSTDYVRKVVLDFLNTLIDMGIAGFRVDAAKHMWPADLQYIFGNLHNLNTEFFPSNTQALIFQEVVDMNDGGAVTYDQYINWGIVCDFRYGNNLGPCFQGHNDLRWLKNFGSAWGLLPPQNSIIFVENHDKERDGGNYINYKDSQEYKMAIAFMLAWDFPAQVKILSSFAFDNRDNSPPQDGNHNILPPTPIKNNVCSNGWNCQHRWRQIYNMIAFRTLVQGTSVTNWWDNAKNQIAFCRGNKAFIAFNLEQSYALNQKLQTCLPPGTYCDIVSGDLVSGSCTGKSITVGSDGTANIQIATFNPASQVDGFFATTINKLAGGGGGGCNCTCSKYYRPRPEL